MADGAADDHRLDTATTVRTKRLKSNARNIADDADANGARDSGAAELPAVWHDAACDLVSCLKDQQVPPQDREREAAGVPEYVRGAP
jgi:hypothetical protein